MIDIQAPDGLGEWLRQHIELPAASQDEADRVNLGRTVRKQATDLLETEGYFSPRLNWRDGARQPPQLVVEPGPRVQVTAVDLVFEGELAHPTNAEQQGRVAALRASWALPVGQPFRSVDWDNAKQALLLLVRERDFASAEIRESQAEIDPATARARLRLVLDSGPSFTLGAIEVDGLERYPRSLIDRYSRLAPGQGYSEERLLELQRALQNSPYFSSVLVEIDRDPAHASAVPVRIHVTEAKTRRLSLGLGYSSNNGPRTEVLYRDSNIGSRGWVLASGLRLDGTGQLGYADILLPPTESDWRDSFGVLGERDTSQGLSTHRLALGAVRTRNTGRIETSISLKAQAERREVDLASSTSNRALVLDGSWTWRNVDSLLDPRSGQVVALQVGGASRALLSDRNFVRTQVRAQQYWPVFRGDVLTVRAELGVTAAAARDGIPEEYLFRTGGAQSIRGYPYRAVGVSEGAAVVGGRYLVSASVEYVHWLSAQWGAAVFQDVGNASDDPALLKPLKSGVGFGVRWRSPAGPLALDLAYNQQTHQLRPSFSIAIVF